MMLKVQRFINELMTSNCYVVYNEDIKRCLVIDPASERSLHEIEFIEKNGLVLDYIILSHEHTDHTWGVNSLKKAYPSAKVVCSELCKQNLKKEIQAYFLFYYDDPSYRYTVCQIDVTTEELDNSIEWYDNIIEIIPTPGHSMGSICIFIDSVLFSGDAILMSKPYVNKRNGNKEMYIDSVNKILSMFNPDTLIYPGHGEYFKLKEYSEFIEKMI